GFAPVPEREGTEWVALLARFWTLSQPNLANQGGGWRRNNLRELDLRSFAVVGQAVLRWPTTAPDAYSSSAPARTAFRSGGSMPCRCRTKKSQRRRSPYVPPPE